MSTEQALEAAAQAKPSRSRVRARPAHVVEGPCHHGAHAGAPRAAPAPRPTPRRCEEAKEPHFKLDESGALVPDIRAEAAIIYNPRTGQVLWEQNSQDQRSIASITKVMTAAVVSGDPADLDTEVVIQRADVYRASTTYIRAGDK